MSSAVARQLPWELVIEVIKQLEFEPKVEGKSVDHSFKPLRLVSVAFKRELEKTHQSQLHLLVLLFVQHILALSVFRSQMVTRRSEAQQQELQHFLEKSGPLFSEKTLDLDIAREDQLMILAEVVPHCDYITVLELEFTQFHPLDALESCADHLAERKVCIRILTTTAVKLSKAMALTGLLSRRPFMQCMIACPPPSPEDALETVADVPDDWCSRVADVILTNVHIGGEEASLLNLSSNRELRWLMLHGNQLGREGARNLRLGQSYFARRLVSLWVSDNNLDAESVAALRLDWHQLEELCLADNLIHDVSCIPAKTLRQVKQLDLSRNTMQTFNFPATTVMAMLNLDRVDLGSVAPQHFTTFAHWLNDNSSLKNLSLRYCSLKDDRVSRLHFGAHGALQYLNLSKNLFTDVGARACGLLRSCTLVYVSLVDMGGPGISAELLETIEAALAQRRENTFQLKPEFTLVCSAFNPFTD